MSTPETAAKAALEFMTSRKAMRRFGTFWYAPKVQFFNIRRLARVLAKHVLRLRQIADDAHAKNLGYEKRIVALEQEGVELAQIIRRRCPEELLARRAQPLKGSLEWRRQRGEL